MKVAWILNCQVKVITYFDPSEKQQKEDGYWLKHLHEDCYVTINIQHPLALRYSSITAAAMLSVIRRYGSCARYQYDSVEIPSSLECSVRVVVAVEWFRNYSIWAYFAYFWSECWRTVLCVDRTRTPAVQPPQQSSSLPWKFLLGWKYFPWKYLSADPRPRLLFCFTAV